jgi:hypothetical protein
MVCLCCNVAGCCRGQTCTVSPNKVCESTGGVPVSVPCDPNPCCPTCEPYVYNTQTRQFTGSCCRSTYIDDGTGACCQTECCTSVPGGPAIGAVNGSCCPDEKPFCCTPTGGNGVFPNQRQCQSVLPTPCPGISDQGFSPCDAGTGRTMTFNVESGPFTARAIVNGTRLRFGGGRWHEADPQDVTIDYGEGEVPLPGLLEFCKPNGVTTITVKIGSVVEYIGPCSVDGATLIDPECDCYRFAAGEGVTPFSPAWVVSFTCWNGCDCNPLP